MNEKINFDGQLRIQDKSQLPECPGVYFVQDANGKIYYVGQSVNIRQRWNTHIRHRQAMTLDAAFLSWIIADESDLNTLEEKYIGLFNPEWNGTTKGLGVDKRPSIPTDLYYSIVSAAVDKRVTVKDWIAAAIEEKLEREKSQ